MVERIIICGGNGVGKSTLGKHLAERLHCPFLDIENYFFPNRKPESPYEEAKSRDEVSRALLTDLQKYEICVLAAVKGNYGTEAEALFTRAVLLEAPKELRMQRIRQRSFQKFGDKMLPGGALYEKEEAFFAMAESRPEDAVRDWLKSLGLPVLRLGGAKPVEENVRQIISTLANANASHGNTGGGKTSYFFRFGA